MADLDTCSESETVISSATDCVTKCTTADSISAAVCCATKLLTRINEEFAQSQQQSKRLEGSGPPQVLESAEQELHGCAPGVTALASSNTRIRNRRGKQRSNIDNLFSHCHRSHRG